MMRPPSFKKERCPVCGKETSALVLHLHREHHLSLREAREYIESKNK
jgi:hypothetical protein